MLARFLVRPQRDVGFTIVELMVIVIVIGILASLSYFSIGAWRERVAETEVKSDLNGVSAGMESARNWSNGYPALDEGAEFNGSGSTASIFTQSENIKMTYYGGDSKEYCIDAVSRSNDSIRMHIRAEGEATTINQGSCDGINHIAYSDDYTVFIFNTNLPGCNDTVRLPVATPASAPSATINWGDGSTGTMSSTPVHTYEEKGSYMVGYNGPVSSVNTFTATVDQRACLQSVYKWGVERITYDAKVSGVNKPHSYYLNSKHSD